MTPREKALRSIAAWKSYEADINDVEIAALQGVDVWAIAASLSDAFADVCNNEPMTTTSGLVEMQRILHSRTHAKPI